jgi:hypothetical protein
MVLAFLCLARNSANTKLGRNCFVTTPTAAECTTAHISAVKTNPGLLVIVSNVFAVVSLNTADAILLAAAALEISGTVNNIVVLLLALMTP